MHPEPGLPGLRGIGETRPVAREGTVDMAVKVLVVEDDDDLAGLLTHRLRSADFAVERAANGEAGVRLTREFDPEFVLMDWMMPVKSGIEATEEIRADPSIRQPYIALLSARNTPDDIIRANQAGIDEYITKPVSPRVVIDRVSEIIERRAALTMQMLRYA
jgi:DNA-binding response OmpR family regulator